MNNKEIEEIKKKLKESTKDLFSSTQTQDFEERGVLNGSEELLEKTDGEQFPDEPEESSPTERRNKFKLHKNK